MERKRNIWNSKKRGSRGKKKPVNDFKNYYFQGSSRITQYDKYGAPVLNKTRYKWQNKPMKLPPPPAEGSEEFTLKKIEETSALIMRQLLSPPEEDQASPICPESVVSESRLPELSVEPKKRQRSQENLDIQENSSSKISRKEYNIDEIQRKIINHISNLNDGKKKNLINTSNSGYDMIIHNINKQKRLEISRALRNICSESTECLESTEFINSIIPDMGIKIEDVPKEFLEELSETIDYNFELYRGKEQFKHIDYPSVSSPFHCDIDQQEPIIIIDDSIEENRNDTRSTLSTEQNSSCFEDIKEEEYSASSPIHYVLDQQESIILKEEPVEEIENSPQSNDTPLPLNNVQNSKVQSICIENFKEETDNETNLRGIAKDSQPSGIDSHIFETTSSNTNYDESLSKCDNFFPKETDSNDKLAPTINQIAIKTETTSTLVDDTNTATKSEKSILMDESFLQNCFGSEPETLNVAVQRMFQIDNLIDKLNQYRQNLFKKFLDRQEIRESVSNVNLGSENYMNIDKTGENVDSRSEFDGNDEVNNCESCMGGLGSELDEIQRVGGGISVTKDTNETSTVGITSQSDNKYGMENDRYGKSNNSVSEKYNRNIVITISLPDDQEKVLFLETFDEQKYLLAATESGKIYIFNTNTSHCNEIINVAKAPITSLKICQDTTTNLNNSAAPHTLLFVGSFDQSLSIYNLSGCGWVRKLNFEDSIMCMESQWGYVFIGTKNGYLIRFSVKRKEIEFEDKLDCRVIQVIKATSEGARQVLIVGTSDSMLCVRDALTGLYLRAFSLPQSTFVVRCLELNGSYLYCGTDTNAYVFSFQSGEPRHTFPKKTCNDIYCMKIYNKLLFMGCGNGMIYVYRIPTNRFVSHIQGPGNCVLSMVVVGTKIVVGTRCSKLKSIPIPRSVLRHLQYEY